MVIKSYNRLEAVRYAKKWALSRNPKYYNFDKLGGDCTNFVSQCIYAGCLVMNYSTSTPWYYASLNDRSPSWTGVEFLFNFLSKNKGVGPFGKLVLKNEIEVGDVIQLGNNNNNFYHAVLITKIFNDKIYTSCHTIDSLDRPLDSYKYDKIRYVHIEGFRK